MNSKAGRWGIATAFASAVMAGSVFGSDARGLELSTASVAPSTVVSAIPGKGFTLGTADEAYTLTLRSRLSLRESYFVTDGAVTHDLGIRTFRFFAQGNVVSPNFRYLIQMALATNDYETGSTASASPLFDAYFDLGPAEGWQLRVGQYFVPFDRSRTNRESGGQFPERPQVIGELNLDRDAGVALRNDSIQGGRWALFGGVFGGQGRNRATAEPWGYLFSGRVTYRPWGNFDENIEGDVDRLDRPRLAVGVGLAYNGNTSRQRSTLGTLLTAGTFDYRHAAVDVVLKHSGFYFLGEVISRDASADSVTGDVNGTSTTQVSRSGWGYLLQAGYMLSSRLEAAVRYDRLFADDGTDPALVTTAETLGQEVSVGANYFFKGHALKLQADYTQRFGDGSVPVNHIAHLHFDVSI